MKLPNQTARWELTIRTLRFFIDDPDPGLTVPEIADKLGIHPGCAYNVLKRLRKRSLLAYRKEAKGKPKYPEEKRKEILVYFMRTEPVRGFTSMQDRAIAAIPRLTEEWKEAKKRGAN